MRALPSVLSVLLALVVCFGTLALTRQDVGLAGEALLQMLYGGLGDVPRLLEGGSMALLTRPLGESATKAALLALTGLSVAVAFRVGLFNIGAQGQLIVGALCAAVVGAGLSLPSSVHLPLALLAAALTGAGWALLPALLKVYRGVHEVISTIMLNWVAVSLVESWLVTGPLAAGAQGGASRSGTEEILATAQLPRLLGELSRLHLGFPLAVLLVGGVWLWLFRTTSGYETRAVGLSPEAARAAGIPVERKVVEGMALAGALSGLAGAVLVLGTELKYPATLGAPYGFDGIAIALIGQSHPVGVGLTALFFGVLRAGGTRLQLLGVHRSFPELIQGLALLFVAGSWLWVQLLERRKARVPPGGTDGVLAGRVQLHETPTEAAGGRERRV
jgi:ABC-type uncharacterized transport system permease subunit